MEQMEAPADDPQHQILATQLTQLTNAMPTVFRDPSPPPASLTPQASHWVITAITGLVCLGIGFLIAALWMTGQPQIRPAEVATQPEAYDLGYDDGYAAGYADAQDNAPEK